MSKLSRSHCLLLIAGIFLVILVNKSYWSVENLDQPDMFEKHDSDHTEHDNNATTSEPTLPDQKSPSHQQNKTFSNMTTVTEEVFNSETTKQQQYSNPGNKANSNGVAATETISTNETATNSQQSSQPYQKGFIMMHMLKAGGNSVEHLLGTLGWSQKQSNQSIYQSGLGYVWLEDDDAIHWYHNFTDNVYLNDKFRGEHSNALPPFGTFPRDDFFRIGMVREPCDYMVSVWAFSGKGKHGNLAGRCGGEEGLTNFSHFLAQTTTPFLTWLSYRMAIITQGDDHHERQASKNLILCPDQVRTALMDHYVHTMEKFQAHEVADCWVRTENMQSDLRQCLKIYAVRRGTTNLNIENLDSSDQQHSLWRPTAPAANKGSHKPCGEYYSEQEAQSVWAREGKMAEQFGYKSCCGGLFNNSLVFMEEKDD